MADWFHILCGGGLTLLGLYSFLDDSFPIYCIGALVIGPIWLLYGLFTDDAPEASSSPSSSDDEEKEEEIPSPPAPVPAPPPPPYGQYPPPYYGAPPHPGAPGAVPMAAMSPPPPPPSYQRAAASAKAKGGSDKKPLDILKERLAKGDIDLQTYKEMKAEIEGTSSSKSAKVTHAKAVYYCPNCGTKQDDLFCPACGTKKP